MHRSSSLLAVLFLASCTYSVTVGRHDSGAVGTDADQAPDGGPRPDGVVPRPDSGSIDSGIPNQCAVIDCDPTRCALIDCVAGCHPCGFCLEPGNPDPACDPPCSSARAGDFCTPGRYCPRGCDALVCSSQGMFRIQAGRCDGGLPPDTGAGHDGGGLERCGRVLCQQGTSCCNPSCSLCVPEGAGCHDGLCMTDCSRQEAYPGGACGLHLGWAWNGQDCVSVSGCRCDGVDCANLFRDPMECLAYFGACAPSISCGGFAGAVCPPDQYCDFNDVLGGSCGATDGAGVCRPRPNVCPPVIAPVCGCDGQLYSSECDAYAAGWDISTSTTCGDCAPDDARGEGSCRIHLGWRWTGMVCEAIGGCNCVGTDCQMNGLAPYSTETECRDAHALCVIPL